MSQDTASGDKPHEATAHKLDEARKKGELAISADLTAAAGYGGMLVAALVLGPGLIERLGTLLTALLSRPEEIGQALLQGSAQTVGGGLLFGVGRDLLGLLAVSAGFALLAVIGTRSFVVAPQRIRPKLNRIDPIATAKRKYGLTGLFEFAKSFVKLCLYGGLLGAFLMQRLPELAGSAEASPRGIGLFMVVQMTDFLSVVVPIALAIGAVDYLWQRHDHLRRNRMTHQDMKDEHKQHEGDPAMKQERRQRAAEIAASQMMAAVPEADVVIVNPTHFAVALTWSRAPGSAPECVAKGVDHMAQAIREKAMEAGVPIRHDPPTARALYATTEIGQEIPHDQYRAVAAAIRFASAMRRKARSFG